MSDNALTNRFPARSQLCALLPFALLTLLTSPALAAPGGAAKPASSEAAKPASSEAAKPASSEPAKPASTGGATKPASGRAVKSAIARAEERPKLVEASVGALILRVRPAHVRPGELFMVEVEGAGLQQAEAKLGKSTIPLFEAGEGRLRGYGAIPVSTRAGKAAVAIEAKVGRKRVQGQVGLTVDPRDFPRRNLRVAKRFTTPSKERQERQKADRAAFARAYEVPFGPPLFDQNFLNPREGAAVNARFGQRRLFNGKQQSRHMGLDLEGRTGDPILAANDGVVTMVRDCYFAGNSVVVAHGAGLFTSYFHLSRFDVEVGQKVKRGDLLGLVGATGRVTGPHLHLSAKVNGITFDPESLFDFDFFPEQRQAPVAAGAGGEPERGVAAP
jgi:murein DD-endopeptidase MepM/ murein hydrolase activator NlpD